jgi:hypothetical protein
MLPNWTSITPQSPLRRVDLINRTNHTDPINPTRVPLIIWGSMPLMTMSTTVITVLHSVEVVHVTHESRSSSVAGYLLYRRVPLHTSGVCARTSLQGCSMVSIVCRVPAEVSPEVSVQITKGPLLRHVVLRRVHSLAHSFPTRRIPRESTQSAPLIDTPN